MAAAYVERPRRKSLQERIRGTLGKVFKTDIPLAVQEGNTLQTKDIVYVSGPTTTWKRKAKETKQKGSDTFYKMYQPQKGISYLLQRGDQGMFVDYGTVLDVQGVDPNEQGTSNAVPAQIEIASPQKLSSGVSNRVVASTSRPNSGIGNGIVASTSRPNSGIGSGIVASTSAGDSGDGSRLIASTSRPNSGFGNRIAASTPNLHNDPAKKNFRDRKKSFQNYVYINEFDEGPVTQSSPSLAPVDVRAAGEGNLEISIMGGGRNLQNRVQPSGPGKFDVSYTPLEGGEHSANITFNDQHVPGMWNMFFLILYCLHSEVTQLSLILTHWGQDKMDTFFQTTFSMHFLEWKCTNFDENFT